MSSLNRLGTVGKMFVPQQFKPSVDKEDINMAKGENIFNRKDGRWEARYIKGYELSAKSNMASAMERLIGKPRKK